MAWWWLAQKGGCALLGQSSPSILLPRKSHYTIWEAEINVCLIPRVQNFPKNCFGIAG